MKGDKIIVDGCELTRDERERSVTYKGTHGDVEFVVVQTIWKTWRAIATVLPRSARLRMEREADTQERATEQLTAIVNDVRTALATPPLAPCEPSAETPTLEACKTTFNAAYAAAVKAKNTTNLAFFEHEFCMAGIEAVRLRCLRAREAPTERAS